MNHVTDTRLADLEAALAEAIRELQAIATDHPELADRCRITIARILAKAGAPGAHR